MYSVLSPQTNYDLTFFAVWRPGALLLVTILPLE